MSILRDSAIPKHHPIRVFLVENVLKHPGHILSIAAEEFKVSRPAVFRHMQILIAAGIISKTGSRNKTIYYKPDVFTREVVLKNKGLEESVLWSQNFAFLDSLLPSNIQLICYYAFTEMVNNVIDHSGGAAFDAEN